MEILPGLTTTKKDCIQPFLEAMRAFGIQRIALFPTCLDRAERENLYKELERFENLVIPHVHLRSDADEGEMEYLAARFKTEAFNIHPRASEHPFPDIPARFASRVFIENTNIAPEHDEVLVSGGICPDFSHWENAKLQGRSGHDEGMKVLADSFIAGCCHLAAVRHGDPNDYNGEWDHHSYKDLDDFSYLTRYREYMPTRWASLELENGLEEQLAAAKHIERLLNAP